jgi:hypothetical protein
VTSSCRSPPKRENSTSTDPYPAGGLPIDLDDAPELDDKFFERADEYLGESLVKRSQPEVAK